MVERDNGNAIGGEGIRGQPSPGQRVAGEGEHLPGAALAQERARGGPAGSRTVSAEDPNLLLPRVVGLAEGNAKGDVLGGATVTRHDEFVAGVGPECCRGGAPGVGVDGQDESGGAWRCGECVQITWVDAPVGAVGGAVEVVRHGWVSPSLPRR